MRPMLNTLAALALVTMPLAAPAVAQMPGAADLSRVEAGTYKVDPNHTQVILKVNHMGITPLYGAFAAGDGTLTIDPKNPTAAKVTVSFPLTGLTVTSPGFMKHLSSADFFDAAKYPDAQFVSTSVRVDGKEATITGNLTIKGITKPVTLEAEFYGAGANPQSQALNIGFKAETTIKRSDFGLGMAVPVVSDEVELEIVAAFVK